MIPPILVSGAYSLCISINPTQFGEEGDDTMSIHKNSGTLLSFTNQRKAILFVFALTVILGFEFFFVGRD